MRKPLLAGLALAVVLVALAVLLPSLRTRLQEEEPPAAPPTLATVAPTPTPATPLPTASSPPISPSPVASPEPRELKKIGARSLDAQVAAVVASMDRTGRPPSGVVQGGRRGSRAGVFQNAERRLPVHAPGYYRESDVWPSRGGKRGPDRLVFGKSGEVYYSADHYRSFVRLR